MTATEFEELPTDESGRTELDEGKVVWHSFYDLDAGACGAEILFALADYARAHEAGNVYAASPGFELSEDTVRAPGGAFVRKERLAAVHRKGFGKGAPDLAVEIFSPSDSVRQLMRKVKQYFAAGCHTVWIVYPERREIQVLEATGADRLLGAGDSLEAPELLPGFSAPIQPIFG